MNTKFFSPMFKRTSEKCNHKVSIANDSSLATVNYYRMIKINSQLWWQFHWSSLVMTLITQYDIKFALPVKSYKVDFNEQLQRRYQDRWLLRVSIRSLSRPSPTNRSTLRTVQVFNSKKTQKLSLHAFNGQNEFSPRDYIGERKAEHDINVYSPGIIKSRVFIVTWVLCLSTLNILPADYCLFTMSTTEIFVYA